MGLNIPIVGDDLYGIKSNRLYLHASFISFIHPKTREIVKFEVPADF
jgi:tRNA pseudouridine32 synthase/23S rRNA pseudouridine746 synthase